MTKDAIELLRLMQEDQLEWLRLHKLAGDIIANFSPADAPNDVPQRELDEVKTLHDRCDVILSRMVARWLVGPVEPGATTH